MEKSMTYAVLKFEDLEFGSFDGHRKLLDLYLPQNVGKPVPVIIWLHGGGWRIGDRRLAPDLSKYFAEHGFAMVSIDYRLSGEAQYPAQIHDVKAAIKWVRSMSDKYGFDGGHIGLWGSSAGGHLAALAGTAGSGILEEVESLSGLSTDVQAVVDGYGPIDFFKMHNIDFENLLSKASIDEPESKLLQSIPLKDEESSRESEFLGAPLHVIPDRVREANPITHIKNGVPPFLILHGLSDQLISPDQSQLLYEALAEKGNDVTLYLLYGQGHAFFNKTELFTEPIEAICYSSNCSESTDYREGKAATITLFEITRQFFCDHLLVK